MIPVSSQSVIYARHAALHRKVESEESGIPIGCADVGDVPQAIRIQ